MRRPGIARAARKVCKQMSDRLLTPRSKHLEYKVRLHIRFDHGEQWVLERHAVRTCRKGQLATTKSTGKLAYHVPRLSLTVSLCFWEPLELSFGCQNSKALFLLSYPLPSPRIRCSNTGLMACNALKASQNHHPGPSSWRAFNIAGAPSNDALGISVLEHVGGSNFPGAEQKKTSPTSRSSWAA